MTFSHHHRSLLAWTLYVSILCSAFACSLTGGQLAGLALGGAGEVFCVIGTGSGVNLSDDSDSTNSLTASYSCPLCTTVSLGMGLLLALSWLLRLFSPRFVAPANTRRTPPRYSWPSANPRASPAYFA